MIATNTKAENMIQADAFRRMKGNILDLIELYGADFRGIIIDFQRRSGRIPTADDLLWIESQRAGRDITQD